MQSFFVNFRNLLLRNSIQGLVKTLYVLKPYKLTFGHSITAFLDTPAFHCAILN